MPNIYKFPNPVLIKVSGKDATRYLNARLSNDLRKLTNSNHLKAACLTANGRTLGYFDLFKHNEDYILFCTGGDKESLINAVKQFIVADRVTVTELVDYHLFHVAGDLNQIDTFSNLNINADLTALEENSFIIKNPRIDTNGYDFLIDNNSSLNSKLPDLVNLNDNDFNFLRTSQGTLSFPEELNEENLFAESGLKEAVAFNKGCYVGQEVIEMIDARGTLPYIILQFEISTLENISPEQDIYGDLEQTKKIGSIISTAKDPNNQKTVGFLRIKNKSEFFNSAFVNGQKLNLLN